MKIRNGFVSNSSSSSFCIYGAYVEFNNDLSSILKLFKKIQEVKPDEYKNWVNSKILDECNSESEIAMYEFLLNTEKTKKKFLSLKINKSCNEGYEDEAAYELQDCLINLLEFMGLYACYNGNLYIGRRYENIGDSETGKQFRDSTQEIITKLFKKKCQHLEEIIYD